MGNSAAKPSTAGSEHQQPHERLPLPAFLKGKSLKAANKERASNGNKSSSSGGSGRRRQTKQQITMDRASLLVPGTGPDRSKQIKDAKDMWNDLVKRAEKAGQKPPPYTFLELIGKGGYGRVYKCKKNETGELVAVKIVDVDTADLELSLHDRDVSLKDFHKEVKVLTQLNASNAENILFVHEAFDLHSQLWIVSDYCPGGSVTTLMRASPPTQPGLEEKFIIPIARELVKAVRSVHDFGAIHRDIKCGNVYITEDGAIQLGDFGIVRIIGESSSATDDNDDDEAAKDPRSKRMTIVGTPNFMPLEMLEDSFPDEGYGTEVDIWSFGCTIYEMATGHAPMVHVRGDYNLAATLASTGEPRLEDTKYSQELRDFVAFILTNDAKKRPTAQQILSHPYIAGTEDTHPTSSVMALIDRYMMWEYKGGVRSSLWMEGGAAAPPSADETGLQDGDDDSIDWNFSVSDNFDKDFANRISRLYGLDFEVPHGSGLPPIQTQGLTVAQRIAQEHQDRSANRGEQSLRRLFDAELPTYKLGQGIAEPIYQPTPPPEPESDLPLRRLHQPSEPRESVIDLDALSSTTQPNFDFDLDDITARPRPSRRPDDDDEPDDDEYAYVNNNEEETSKRDTLDWTFPSDDTAQKRATMDWTFPSTDLEPATTMKPRLQHDNGDLGPGFRPALKHTATAPVGVGFGFESFKQGHQIAPLSSSPPRNSMASMIDLDAAFADPIEMRRPSTASSTTESVHTDLTSGDPFDLEDDSDQNEADRNRFSYHKQWHSKGGSESNRGSLRNLPMHSRSTSLTSSGSELDSMARSSTFGPEINYNYDRKVNDPMSENLGPNLDSDAAFDLNKWPDFGPHDDTMGPAVGIHQQYHPNDIPRLDNAGYSFGSGGGVLHSNGVASRSPSRARGEPGWRGELEFPNPVPPNPEALQEGADPELVAAEMERLMSDLEVGFTSLAMAFAQASEEMDNHDDERLEAQGGESGAEAGEEDEIGY
ncbi:kinase-like protein [Polychaeton citri CBS 116435]|uniref:non-specific serine/threonine protein kinase n=1 Tax=Polychaeton citri CBS 116435 TaxID=1314669 RepID=A0A9P4UNL2_9PEZI|nr:kinase-like protein [Polychaeton citri CBS 116435]